VLAELLLLLSCLTCCWLSCAAELLLLLSCCLMSFITSAEYSTRSCLAQTLNNHPLAASQLYHSTFQPGPCTYSDNIR
jgi:hypothetical protein